jgi:hypothetical protein
VLWKENPTSLSLKGTVSIEADMDYPAITICSTFPVDRWAFLQDLLNMAVLDEYSSHENVAHFGMPYCSLDHVVAEFFWRDGVFSRSLISETSRPARARLLISPWGYDGSLKLYQHVLANLGNSHSERISNLMSLIDMKILGVVDNYDIYAMLNVSLKESLKENVNWDSQFDLPFPDYLDGNCYLEEVVQTGLDPMTCYEELNNITLYNENDLSILTTLNMIYFLIHIPSFGGPGTLLKTYNEELGRDFKHNEFCDRNYCPGQFADAYTSSIMKRFLSLIYDEGMEQVVGSDVPLLFERAQPLVDWHSKEFKSKPDEEIFRLTKSSFGSVNLFQIMEIMSHCILRSGERNDDKFLTLTELYPSLRDLLDVDKISQRRAIGVIDFISDEKPAYQFVTIKDMLHGCLEQMCFDIGELNEPTSNRGLPYIP